MDAGQQHDRDRRQRGGDTESRRGADPSDQHAAERGAAGKRNRARELDAGIGGGQQLRADQRRHQRRRGDAVDHGAADRDEAEQGEPRQREPMKRDQHEDRGERHCAQRFGTRHQPSPRHAVGEQTRGNRKQHEGQGQRSLQQAGLAFADAEQEHGDDRRGRECDLLGRLRRQVRPGEAVEGRWQFGGLGGHRGTPGNASIGRHLRPRERPNPPDYPTRFPTSCCLRSRLALHAKPQLSGSVRNARCMPGLSEALR